MASKVPTHIANEIKKKTFTILDERNYLQQSRKENGQLMADLVSMPEIGGVLADYMPKSAIKTYIKDAIINAYAKAAYLKALSVNIVEEKISQKEGVKVNWVEGKCSDKLLFLRAENGVLFVAGIGTVSKWETSLRKALEFIEKAPKLPPQDCKLKIYLILLSLEKHMPQSELDHIVNSLKFINVNVEVISQ